MREICMSGLMSGEGKRSVAAWPKPPRPSSTLLKRGKNDATDAEAICEAVRRPNMRFVPVKSADQQAVLMLHRTRALLIRQQTMLANAFRAHLAEFGIVVPQGIRHVRALIERVFGEGADAIDLPDLVSRFRSSYAHFACVSSVRRQKRSMDARMSPADFVQRNGLGAAFLILI